VTIHFLSRSMQALGRIEELPELLNEGLRLAAETGDQLSIGMMMERMAVLAAETGKDEAEARRLFDECVEQFRNIGDAWSISRALNLRGYFALALGEDLQARESFLQACRAAMPARIHACALDALTGLAMLEARAGRHEQVFEWVLQILDNPASTKDTRNRAETLCLEMKANLTPRQIETVQARPGKSIEELAEEILGASG